ncbi:hypothetical protein PINS_up012794 [Pythium insidiosum]|nr:hypothetical protein PINS_up012794 [Pythium insidiosum]
MLTERRESPRGCRGVLLSSYESWPSSSESEDHGDGLVDRRGLTIVATSSTIIVDARSVVRVFSWCRAVNEYELEDEDDGGAAAVARWSVDAARACRWDEWLLLLLPLLLLSESDRARDAD